MLYSSVKKRSGLWAAMSLTHYVGCRKSCFICNIWSTPKRDKMMSAISVCSPSPSRNGEMKNDSGTCKFNDPKTLSGFVFAIMALHTEVSSAIFDQRLNGTNWWVPFWLVAWAKTKMEQGKLRWLLWCYEAIKGTLNLGLYYVQWTKHWL